MKLRNYCIVLLILLSLAGAAQAADSGLYDKTGTSELDNVIYLGTSETINISCRTYNINPDCDYLVYQLSSLGGFSDSDLALFRDQYILNGATDVMDTDLFSVTMPVDADADTYYGIRVTIDAYKFEEGATEPTLVDSEYVDQRLDGASPERQFELIPEFPTVALPVAAIIGLAFFMQRRKEE